MAGTASPRDREAILRAAGFLIGRHGTTAVEDILHVARVNRRIFYRHFPTKDALLAVLAEQGATAIWQQLAAAATATPAASAAQAWIDRYLGLVPGGGTGGVARAFFAPDATAGVAVAAVVETGHGRHRELLVDVLRRGRADGSLPAAEPETDAFVVHAAVLRQVELQLGGYPRPDLEAARASITGVLRRLGAPGGC